MSGYFCFVKLLFLAIDLFLVTDYSNSWLAPHWILAALGPFNALVAHPCLVAEEYRSSRYNHAVCKLEQVAFVGVVTAGIIRRRINGWGLYTALMPWLILSERWIEGGEDNSSKTQIPVKYPLYSDQSLEIGAHELGVLTSHWPQAIFVQRLHHRGLNYRKCSF